MRTEVIAFRLQPHEKERLEQIADRDGLRMSEFVRRLVRNFITRERAGAMAESKSDAREAAASDREVNGCTAAEYGRECNGGSDQLLLWKEAERS